MQRSLLLLLLIMVPFVAFGDLLVTVSGEDYDVHIVEFTVDSTTADFSYRLWQGGELAVDTRTIKPREITRIEFRNPGDDNPMPKGRTGHLTLKSGAEHFNVRVLTAVWHEGSFYILTILEVGQKITPINGPDIESLVFAPPLTIDAPKVEDPEDPDTWKFRESELDFQYEDPFNRPPPPVPANEIDRIVQEREDKLSEADPTKVSADPSNQTAFEAFQFFGGLIGLKSIVLAMVLGFVLGGMMLRFSAKSCGIEDVSFARLMVCALLLSTIPPTLFFVLFWIFPLFIGLKLFTGLSAFYISARMIVMGMVEVLEGKATEILVTFYGVWVLLLIVIAKVL